MSMVDVSQMSLFGAGRQAVAASSAPGKAQHGLRVVVASLDAAARSSQAHSLALRALLGTCAHDASMSEAAAFLHDACGQSPSEDARSLAEQVRSVLGECGCCARGEQPGVREMVDARARTLLALEMVRRGVQASDSGDSTWLRRSRAMVACVQGCSDPRAQALLRRMRTAEPFVASAMLHGAIAQLRQVQESQATVERLNEITGSQAFGVAAWQSLRRPHAQSGDAQQGSADATTPKPTAFTADHRAAADRAGPGFTPASNRAAAAPRVAIQGRAPRKRSGVFLARSPANVQFSSLPA